MSSSFKGVLSLFFFLNFRLFKEYEEKYLYLFDLGLIPEEEVPYPHFNSERELSLLKEHFL